MVGRIVCTRLCSKQDLEVHEELRMNMFSGWKELEPDAGGLRGVSSIIRGWAGESFFFFRNVSSEVIDSG